MVLAVCQKVDIQEIDYLFEYSLVRRMRHYDLSSREEGLSWDQGIWGGVKAKTSVVESDCSQEKGT